MFFAWMNGVARSSADGVSVCPPLRDKHVYAGLTGGIGSATQRQRGESPQVNELSLRRGHNTGRPRPLPSAANAAGARGSNQPHTTQWAHGPAHFRRRRGSDGTTSKQRSRVSPTRATNGSGSAMARRISVSRSGLAEACGRSPRVRRATRRRFSARRRRFVFDTSATLRRVHLRLGPSGARRTPHRGAGPIGLAP